MTPEVGCVGPIWLDEPVTVHLVSGDDESLVLSGVTELVHRLVGDGDRSLLVDDFDSEDYELRAVVDAAPATSAHR